MRTFIRDNTIYIYILLFLIVSYLGIYNSSIYSSKENLYYKQIIWYIIGLSLIYIIKRINIKKIYNFSLYLYIINLLLLIGLIPFGTSINGSRSWYSFLGISFQPSEFMKISLLLLNSNIIDYFYKKKDKISRIQEFKMILSLFIVLLIPSIITFLEPDTGAVIGYLIITISMLYISNINKIWFTLLSIIITTFLILFFLIYFNNQDLFISIFGSSFFYRIDRIINWKTKSGMQLNNSLIAIGSSGFIQNRKVPLYFPEAQTDFIFTSFESSYGLLGGIILILIIFTFDIYFLNQIKKEPNKHNKYVLFGIISLFLYQQIQSIAMTIGLLPITGITLPLISYGGTSVISYLILVGLYLNIRKI